MGLLGRRAAEQGISAGRAVQLYLSAARRLWQELPMVVRSRAGSELGWLMHGELRPLPRGRPWRIAVGRAHPGLCGIARSYEEAREALTMAGRLHVELR